MIQNEKQKIPPCQNSLKIQQENRRNRQKIDTPNTHMHARSLSCLSLGTSINSGRVKLV